MNIGVHVSLSILVSSVCMPSSGISGFHVNSISRFLRNLHTILHSGCTGLHFHQQCKRVPFSIPSPAFIFCRLFHSIYSEWHEMVPLCGFDLHFSDNEWCWASFHVIFSHLYCMSSLEKCLFSSLAYFLIGSFILSVLSCMSCLYINSLSVALFAIFPPILWGHHHPNTKTRQRCHKKEN